MSNLTDVLIESEHGTHCVTCWRWLDLRRATNTRIAVRTGWLRGHAVLRDRLPWIEATDLPVCRGCGAVYAGCAQGGELR